MKVYVVMGNDFPDAVFDSQKKAEQFIEQKKKEDDKIKEKYYARIYWRAYEFELNKGDSNVQG